MKARRFRQLSRFRGFTLLEIIIVLAIVAVMSTLFAFQVVETISEETLRKSAAELQRYARRAIRQSSSYGEETRITFLPEGFFLGPESGKGVSGDFHSLPGNVSYLFRRNAAAEWIEPEGEVWIFPPGGLCDSIEVRFEMDPAFIELTFNPLTALVESESAFFP